MRVLVLSDTPFLPSTAGNRRRIDEMLRFLGDAGVELGMVMLPAPDRAEWDEAGMRGRLSRFEVAAPPLGSRLVARLRGAGRPDGSRGALGVDDWCAPWFRAHVARVADEWRPDAVLAEYVYLSACLDALDGRGLRVLDTHDLMHRRAAVYAGAGLPPQWFHTSREEECRGLRRADVVLAMHEADAAVLRSMAPDADVLAVGHGATVALQPPEAARALRLLFVASYNDLNVAGLRWFLDEVWPELRAAVPGAELHVCGAIAQKLPPPPAGVTLRGILPELRDEYAAARVVIDPVAWGTGQPIKVIEALAHGRPVVARRPDPSAVGEAVLVGEDAASVAAAIRSLLHDDARWTALARAAAHAAEARCASDVVYGPLLRRLRSGRAR